MRTPGDCFMILLDMYITIISTPDDTQLRGSSRLDNPPVRNAVTKSNGFLSNKMKEL